MTITLSKKEIFDEVEKRSALEGSVLVERFENIWASEEEGKFLDSYWKEGYTAVVQLLKRYINDQTINYNLNDYNKDEIVTIEAEMPKRFNTLLEGSIATDIKMMIACNILHGWLEVMDPEAAARYQEESKGYSEDLRVKLLYRTSPENKSYKAVADDSHIYPKYEYLEEAKKDCVPIPPQWGKCGNSENKEYVRRCDCECNELHPFGFDVCR